jgi:hypothetical protein
MQTMYYIGLDVHERTISYCVKDGSGTIHAEGTIPATRFDLDRWMRTLPQPWTAAMEATVFYRVDLRSPAATRRGAESGSPADAAGHRGGEKEERSYRRQQDLRLPALRFPAGVLHGLDRHSRAALPGLEVRRFQLAERPSAWARPSCVRVN